MIEEVLEQSNTTQEYTLLKKKKEKLKTVVEDIRRRFGKYAIQPACLYQDLKMAPNDVELKMPTGLIG